MDEMEEIPMKVETTRIINGQLVKTVVYGIERAGKFITEQDLLREHAEREKASLAASANDAKSREDGKRRL